MTREEARQELTHELRVWESECKSAHPMKDALRMAIEALSKDEITLEAPQELNEFVKDYVRCYMKKVGEELQKARPHGEWIELQSYNEELDTYVPFIECNKCGFAPYYGGDVEYNFCPNCGADMRGGDEWYRNTFKDGDDE